MIKIALAAGLGLTLIVMAMGQTSAKRSSQAVLDQDVHVSKFEPMKYPLLARNAHIQGMVVVRATLDGHGNVIEASVISGARALIPETQENAKKWKFEPNPENAAVIIYDFTIPGVCDSSEWGTFMFRSPNVAMVYGCAVPVETSRSARE